MLRGNQLTPEAAKDIGLITDSFEKSEFHTKIQLFADQMSRRIPVAVEGIKLAVHDGMETSFRHGLSIEMEQTVRCFTDPVTARALDEYIEIIKENIEVPEDQRLPVNKVVELLQSEDFSRKISK
jgi:enoyl-CoA hydratase